ncbi:MAG: nucleobase:cation symporter, family [Actinomycetota bacterium]|nr:nucleobase:cation symporter, family [Actinomycetota bacterium]
MSTISGSNRSTAEPGRLGVELNGINVIAEEERKGAPRDLFWPWFAANISVLAIPYGAFILGFKVSFWQAAIAGVVGVILSFALCGVVALAGKRGSAPTMVLSRAAFGVDGNRLPAFLSWILLVGWETVLVSLSALATATVFTELGWGGGTFTKIVAFLVTAALVVFAGVLGFDVIMRLQAVITVATAVLTVAFIATTIDEVHWAKISGLGSGTTQGFVGALALVATGFGVGWANTAADYSRYLPRSASSRGVFGWTTVGGALAPIVLVVYGIMLVASKDGLADKIYADPIGALTTLLPTWFLVPYAIVAILGLVGGAVLDIYSSGLALLTLGVKVPRPVAAGIDGIIMIAGSIYVVFVADNFIGPFQAFLITVGVPIAAWAGIFVADLLQRHGAYADAELYDGRGRYGSVRWPAVVLLVVGTLIGWGLVTTTAPDQGWLAWQGYLLEPVGLGGKKGAWAYANVGVFAAFAIGFVGWLLLGRNTVRRQERVGITAA